MGSAIQRTGWTKTPELPADQVQRILQEKLLVPPKIVAIALDQHLNSINKAIREGKIPTVGTGRSRRVPTAFVRDYIGLSAKEPTTQSTVDVVDHQEAA